MKQFIEELKQKALKKERIEERELFELFEAGMNFPFYLMAAASEIREYFKGKNVNLCGIVNAKSGRCAENCKFCAQSSHYKTETPVYPLLSAEEIINQAVKAKENGAHMFGIVTSGTRITSESEWNEIFAAVKGIKAIGMLPCASLGLLNYEKAVELKESGLFRYHHNLETSKTYFTNICTTHDYEEDIDTIKAVKKANLSICCGGIIGLGEGIEHRIELALLLKELDVDSVPINILNPIQGTPLESAKSLTVLEILCTIAIFRFILSDKDIKLCGGKEKNLRQLLPLGIIAGCNSLMTGNYLTTLGRDTALDLEMINDLGLKAVY